MCAVKTRMRYVPTRPEGSQSKTQVQCGVAGYIGYRCIMRPGARRPPPCRIPRQVSGKALAPSFVTLSLSKGLGHFCSTASVNPPLPRTERGLPTRVTPRKRSGSRRRLQLADFGIGKTDLRMHKRILVSSFSQLRQCFNHREWHCIIFDYPGCRRTKDRLEDELPILFLQTALSH